MTDIPPATLVRQSCIFRDDESAETIGQRIKDTMAGALATAAREGIVRTHVSELYHPYSYADLEAGRGWRKPSTNWCEALCECHFGRYAQYIVVVRNQDYIDYLDKTPHSH